MTPAEKAALLASIAKAQSVGATILSTMSAARRMVEAIDVAEPVQAVAAEVAPAAPVAPVVRFDRRVLLAPADADVDG